MPSPIRLATELDVPAITQLINRAFSVESFFKRGDRIDEAQTRAKLASGSIYVAEGDGIVLGCVYIDVAASGLPNVLAEEPGAGYLGMLSVDPEHQGRGLGSQLMCFAEEELRRRGCNRVQIRIINLRAELHRYYTVKGYRETGISPYPFPNRLSQPVHFIKMEKPL